MATSRACKVKLKKRIKSVRAQGLLLQSSEVSLSLKQAASSKQSKNQRKCQQTLAVVVASSKLPVTLSPSLSPLQIALVASSPERNPGSVPYYYLHHHLTFSCPPKPFLVLPSEQEPPSMNTKPWTTTVLLALTLSKSPSVIDM